MEYAGCLMKCTWGQPRNVRGVIVRGVRPNNPERRIETGRLVKAYIDEAEGLIVIETEEELAYKLIPDAPTPVMVLQQRVDRINKMIEDQKSGVLP